MGCRIAVATSTGDYVDSHFGSASSFTIYDLQEDAFVETEEREINPLQEESAAAPSECGCGCAGAVPSKVKALSDCNAVVCARIGPGAKNQLERSGISAFDVQCTVEEALEKLAAFYKKSAKGLGL